MSNYNIPHGAITKQLAARKLNMNLRQIQYLFEKGKLKKIFGRTTLYGLPEVFVDEISFNNFIAEECKK